MGLLLLLFLLSLRAARRVESVDIKYVPVSWKLRALKGLFFEIHIAALDTMCRIHGHHICSRKNCGQGFRRKISLLLQICMCLVILYSLNATRVEATHALFCKYHACHMLPLSLMCVDFRMCPVWGGIMSWVKDASEKTIAQLHFPATPTVMAGHSWHPEYWAMEKLKHLVRVFNQCLGCTWGCGPLASIS